MGLKKFHEYAEGLGNKKPTKVVSESKRNVNKRFTKPSKKVNESSFLVGQDYKVKSTFDVSQQLVQQYIEKVTEETGRNPLDNFNEAEIAEQMIDYIVKQNLIIDNLPSDFTVGSEPSSDMEKADDMSQADSEQLGSDMGEELPDEEFEIESGEKSEEDNKSEDDGETGEIEFDMEEADIDEEIEVETEDEEPKEEAEPEADFEEIEFDESESESETESEKGEVKPKTVGDYLNKKEGSESEEEEEEHISEVEDLYKKVGYKTGYYESLNINQFLKPY
jgi:hypothetical protein